MRILRIISLFGLIMIVISFLNYIKPLDSSKSTLLYVLFGIQITYRILRLVIFIQLGKLAPVVSVLLNTPLLILFIYYWNAGTESKILTITQGAYMFSSFVTSYVYIAPIFIIFLLTIYARYVLIIIWLSQGIPLLKERQEWIEEYGSPHAYPPVQSEKPIKTNQSAINPQSSYSASTTKRRGESDGIPPSTGWDHGIPRLNYWCPTCNKQVMYRIKSTDDIDKKHPCPTCETPLLSWWVLMTKEEYIRFAAGISVFGAGFATILITTTFGGYGVTPLTLLMILSLAEVFGGVFFVWKTMKQEISGPPPYATSTPSKAPQETFIKEMMIIVIIALIGTLVGYFINVLLVGLFFL